ncbi:MAG TPA: hypothetical protein VFT95_16235, partial [Micromonosporaceae bacterium]|nr:hypothetical protein [Micromonosporaceae bacterium]
APPHSYSVGMRPDPRVREQVNWAQFGPGLRRGHYESFYQRANHPTEPLAFWLRYTVFSPARRPEAAVGELWAVVFDGRAGGGHAVAKVEVPIAACAFATDRFDVRIGDGPAAAVLGPRGLRGAAGEIGWSLAYAGDEPPVYLLPRGLYRGGFPKAKSLVGVPLARYDGVVRVGDRRIEVDGWLGSQNHNWGSRHTDRYAFGQVAGFDNAQGSFLEVATARNRVGPVRTPALTLMVLRHAGREHELTGLLRARRHATGRYDHTGEDFTWEFASESDEVRVSGKMVAPRSAFVGLAYADPPGRVKYCLNTKIARCLLTIVDHRTGASDLLVSEHGGLFEILTDDRVHGVTIRA